MNQHKTVLLLAPHRLLTDHLFLQSLHLVRYEQKVEYIASRLDAQELKEYYAHLPPKAREALVCFNRESMHDLREGIRLRFNKQSSDLSFDGFFHHAILRRLQELTEPLKSLTEQVQWYHQLPAGEGRYTTGPCTFSSLRPQLRFEVKAAENGGLLLETLVQLQERLYPVEQFNRHHFLLEKEQEYFLLSHADYLTLQWLGQQPAQQYQHQPQAFAQQLLARLEETYPVNRNQLMPLQQLNVLPQQRVMLSERHPACLVLTPQWLYDGFAVEGAWEEVYETTRQGEIFAILRNQEAEAELIRLLESLHEDFPAQQKGFYYLSFTAARKKQWFLKAYHRLLEHDIQIAGMDLLQHFRYSSHKVATTVSLLQEEEAMVLLQLKVCFGKEEVALGELQKLLQAKQHLLLLKDGTLGVLDDEWLEQYGLVVRHGKLSKTGLQVSRWLAFCEQHVPEGKQVLKPILHRSWWSKWQQWQEGSEHIYSLPAGIKAVLRPYQHKGFEWLALLAEAGAGACLADDMGLGKTLQTICFLAHRLQAFPKALHLIVCPASLLYNWQQELHKFAPHMKSLVYYGASREAGQLKRSNHQVIISTYGTIRADINHLSAWPFDVVVLDESHHIKNPTAQVTRAVGQLQCAMAVALSGTPVMNNTFDLYAQLNFLLPGLFGNREFFKREYADAIDRQRDEAKIRELHRLTSPFLLRRTKQQVAADLPPKTEMILWCKMDTAQKALYEQVKAKVYGNLLLSIQEDGLGKSKMALLAGMMKLRQVCNSPLLLPVGEQDCTESVKTRLLMDELCNNLRGHKVLVFSQFSSMLHLLAAACTGAGIAYYQFDGQTPPAKRAEMAKAFQQEYNQVNVFLISLKAGNAGLNLTAADYVFLFDPWWNTAVQQQAIDRTHRIGQQKKVFAYKMICRDTVEEKIIQLQQQKHQLAEELVMEEEGFVKSLTEEDIAYLFS